MTAAELIERLQEFPGDTEVRLATQPRWAFEYSISDVIGGDPDESDEEEDEDLEPEERQRIIQSRIARQDAGEGTQMIYIFEGSQIGYLPGTVAGWAGWPWC